MLSDPRVSGKKGAQSMAALCAIEPMGLFLNLVSTPREKRFGQRRDFTVFGWLVSVL